MRFRQRINCGTSEFEANNKSTKINFPFSEVSFYHLFIFYFLWKNREAETFKKAHLSEV